MRMKKDFMSYPDILFHDNTLDYMFPLQPAKGGRVTIVLRTYERDAQEVIVCWNGLNHVMSLYERHDGYDFYRIRLAAGEDIIRYYFHVTFTDGDSFNYDRRGFYKPGSGASSRMYFKLIPGLKTPEWAKGAVMYQIFVDRFCSGDDGNDITENEYHYLGKPVRKMADWNAPPPADGDFRTFYGGDLQGVIDKLDYLKDLGVDAIYLNPVFISPSSHKYDTQDYEHIDPHFGKIVVDVGNPVTASGDVTDDHAPNKNATRYICRTTHPENLRASDLLFATLVKKAHERNIRVILDGVFNHCGSFHKWMDRERIYEAASGTGNGAYLTEDSPYRRYFSFAAGTWPENDSYEGWWGYDTLPKLNYEGSEELCDYIIGIGKKWVSEPYNADGWRLDVAADLGHSHEFNMRFWKRFRDAVKEVKPDALILAEHYGPCESWLDAGAWDSVMNYDAFMDPVSLFLTGMEKHSDAYHPEMEGNAGAFWHTMRTVMAENFSAPSAYTAMNELSNHDHSRFLTRTARIVGRTGILDPSEAENGVRPEVVRQAAMIQFTWPGMPTIYYGDEAGVAGFTDPDNRRTYPWGNEDHKMIAWHRELIRLRRVCPELRLGSVREIHSEKGLIAYGRFSAKVASLIVINCNAYALTRDFPLRRLGVPAECTMQRVLISTAEGYRADAVDRHVTGCTLTLTVPPSAALLVRYDPFRPISREEFWKRNFIRFH